jgi:hypothetical protein
MVIRDYDRTVALIAGEIFAAEEDMTIKSAVDYARAIVAEVIKTEPGPTPPEPPVDVVTDQLQAAIDAAPAGATLMLDLALIEPGPITIAKSITLIGARAPDAQPMPSLRGGLTVTGHDVVLLGVELQKTQDAGDIVQITGDTVHLTDCRVLGDPIRGNKRGIMANGPNITLDRCLVDYCFARGQDSQAVCGWDNTINLTLRNCTLLAATENVMIGGADAPDVSRQPANFHMTGCTLTKRPEWRNAGLSVKNIFELKNVNGAHISHNVLEHCWADGQDGYAIVFTPRNQGNTAPWTNVTGVVFQHNTIRHVCTACNLLGTDHPNPSGTMTDVRIRDNVFEDVDCVAYGSTRGPGSNKTILLGAGIEQLAIAGNQFLDTKNMGFGLYFYSTPCDRVDVIDNAFPAPLKYGTIGGDGTAPGQASWDRYVISGTYEGNTP